MGGVKCQPSQHHPIDDPRKYEMKRSAFALLSLADLRQRLHDRADGSQRDGTAGHRQDL